MHDSMFDFINKKVILGELDAKLCRQYFELVSVIKNTILEKEHKSPGHLYFIISGYMRLYYTDDKGGEATTCISPPASFITSFISFVNNTPASENLAAITPCTLLRISRPQLEALIAASEKFKIFSTSIFEQAITYNADRANQLATLSAEQRYKKLMQYNPDIIQNVPVHYIASLLGMQPESLSRIRKQQY